MPREELDNIPAPDARFPAKEFTTHATSSDSTGGHNGTGGIRPLADRPPGRRRTPRKSVIVVLPDNHVVSPEVVATRLPAAEVEEAVEVIVACAGQSASLAALKHWIPGAQVLLAPAGTTATELRELAIRRAPGDIVTLLGGAVVQATTHEFEMFRSV